MKTTTAPRPSSAARPVRPLLVRAAHAWYSWAVLVAAVACSYFAASGHLRFGDTGNLQAAPPEPMGWKPADPPTAADKSKIVLSPSPESNDPFRAAATTSQPKALPLPTPDKASAVIAPKAVKAPIATVKPPAGPSAVDPFVAPAAGVKPALNENVRPVLDAYMRDKDVLPARNWQPAPVTKVDAPAVPISPAPPKPAVNADVPKSGPELPAPKSDDTSESHVVPGLTRASVSPSGPGGARLPAIPPPPHASAVVNTEPVAPGDLFVQEPEVLPIFPRPVGKDEKKEPPPKKLKVLGTLSQEDEIKLNAAQNAARLGDFNRAAALMAEVIANNPNEYDLRAEFAGILLSAGDVKRAIRELEQVIQAAPKVPAYRLLLGDAHMIAGQYRTAADVFMTALEMVAADPRLADRIPEVVIRAARAYALAQDYIKAAQLVDKYLSGIKPDDPRAPLAMGSMLLDLDRPYDALPYLIEKRKQLLASPEASEAYELRLLEVLASMARGYARVGDRQQAMEAIQEFATRAPKQLAIRVTLADILYELGEHELAGHVYNQVLAVDPAHGPALIGIARVYLETFQVAAAKRVLDSFIPKPAHQRLYLLTYSSYHQAVGEYAEAKQIYRDMLRRNENDHEVRFALGRLYEYTSEWEKAKAEFAKIPPQDRMGRRARLWFGMALLHQRKFAEAAQVAELFMRDDPNNPEGVTLHVRALAKMGQFDRAVQSGRGYLATNPRDDRAITTVRLAIARALLEANRNLDAAREYEIVLSKPAGRVAEAYYGLARAAEKLGNVERAHEIIKTLCGPAAADFRTRVLIADYYALDFEDDKVIEIINSFPGFDNNNLALLIRLADAQQRSSRWSGDPSDAFGTTITILRQSPTNVRGHLVMARSFAVAQNYRKASVQYDQLIAIDPDFTIPARERARILFGDKQYSAARTQYNVLLSPTPEEIVLGQMSYHAQRDAKVRQAFSPYLGGHMNGPAVRSELTRLAASSPDEEVRQTAHRLVCDYDATLAWQEAIRLERDGKELRDYRNYMAIPQYNAATQFEPTNVEALFDQGQTYGNLKMTRASLSWYSNVLAVDPTHRDASVASERASAEISPKLDLRGEWFRQRGRDGVASIDRQKWITGVSLPLGDENEFVQIGYMRLGYNPLDDTQLWGNAPFVRVQKKWDDNRLMTYGQVNLEEFEDRFSTRPTFDVGYWYDHNDVVRHRGGLFLENVAENGESMRQDIYRYGLYCGTDVRPTRVWAFGGTYTYSHYSDNNDAHQAFLYNEVSLSLPPKQLKLSQRVNVWCYRDQTVFATNPPDPYDMRGTVHPYFAPESFSSYEARIEWWHWLSRDYFTHSNQCWYSLQYAVSTDNQLVTYHDVRAIFNYDINSCLSIGAEARSLNSSVYDLYSAMGFLQIRFLGQ